MSETRKYRKRPVVVEAMQYRDLIRLFVGNAQVLHRLGDERLGIETLEGVMAANPGDFIIKGVNGEFYPCKPDIFFATYEEVPHADR